MGRNCEKCGMRMKDPRYKECYNCYKEDNDNISIFESDEPRKRTIKTRRSGQTTKNYKKVVPLTTNGQHPSPKGHSTKKNSSKSSSEEKDSDVLTIPKEITIRTNLGTIHVYTIALGIAFILGVFIGAWLW